MDSTLLYPIYGGTLIGLSAALLLLFNGKIAGISGILSRALYFQSNGEYWRWFFLLGLISGGALAHTLFNISIPDNSQSWLLAAIAGLFVGVGTRIGNGCTSGHGVCGIGRRSVRSLVATMTFMLVAISTVFIVGRLL